MTEINKLKRVKQELVLRRGALPLEMQEDGGEFAILQSDDGNRCRRVADGSMDRPDLFLPRLLL